MQQCGVLESVGKENFLKVRLVHGPYSVAVTSVGLSHAGIFAEEMSRRDYHAGG
jgi:hypothetical protein